MINNSNKITDTLQYNLNSEWAVLGIFLMWDGIRKDILDELSEKDFSDVYNREIFTTIKKMKSHPDKPYNLISKWEIIEYIEEYGSEHFKFVENTFDSDNKKLIYEYLDFIVMKAGDIKNISYYKADLKRLTSIRKVEKVLEIQLNKLKTNNIIDFDDFVTSLNNSLHGILVNQNIIDNYNNKDSVDNFLENVINEKKYPNEIKKILSGIEELDIATGGLKEGNLIVIAGRPGNGKTTFSLNVANNLLKDGKNVVFVSLEMTKKEILTKLFAMNSNVDSSKISNPTYLNNNEIMKLQSVKEDISNFSLNIDDRGSLKHESILESVKKQNLFKQIDAVVIDYVQLIGLKNKQKSENRNTEINQITRSLKLLAKEINAPVIILSQLSREIEKRASKEPFLSDLKDSGSIEQDADIVMFISSDHENNSTNINIAKNRNGKLSKFQMMFDMKTSKFYNTSAKLQQNSKRQSYTTSYYQYNKQEIKDNKETSEKKLAEDKQEIMKIKM